ncbi:MAG: hypothetical protein LBM99_01015, partial [Bacillales bacterium]|nr:hypothetical protein [Bacillales bacterium]
MKKIILSLLLILGVSLPLNVKATTGTVATTNFSSYDYYTGWGTSSSWTPQGVQGVIAGVDTMGGDAWTVEGRIPAGSANPHHSFSIKDNKQVSIELSVGFYGETTVTSQNGPCFDVFIRNATNDNQITGIRVWTDSAGTTNGSHSYVLFDSGWTEYPGDTWIKGDANLSSSFTFTVDKTNGLQSYVGGSEVLTLLNSGSYQSTVTPNFANVDEIYFYVKGNNGFTGPLTTVLKSINGQSLANVDGLLNDTVAPTLNNETVATKIELNEDYTIPLTAYDLFGEVSYAVVDENDVETAGSIYHPTSTGNKNIKFKAIDLAGNEAIRDIALEVIETIEAPIITNVPIAENATLDILETYYFNDVTYTESTGSAVSKLFIRRLGSESYAEISKNADNKYPFATPVDFAGVTLEYYYTVANAGGLVTSEVQSVTISRNSYYAVPFTSGSAVDYVNEGIRFRTNTWASVNLGLFDIRYGIDIKFILP